MPNLYYDNQDPPVPLSRTRAGNEVSDRDRLEQAFDKLPTEDELKSGAVNYTVDTGVADIYVVTIPYATEYFEGLNILFKILNANTGASTIDVNGLGPKSMVSPDGTALEVGDLVAGGATSIVYDGAVFRLVIAASANARSAADAAAASAAAALVSENAALVSENAALASETAAGLSETAAGVSETNSAANAAAALVSENAALVSEGNASTSEGNSSTSAAASLVSENAASVSEGNASTSETNSAASEAAALVSQDAAEDWAIRPEDNPVPVVSGGDGSTTFSSLHWAAKAAAFALAIDLSSPAAIGDVTPNTGDFTDMTLTGSLLQVADAYHNWGATVGDSGYGIRDSSGTMQFKNSAGAWASFDSLGDDLSSPPPIGDVAPNTGAFTTLSTTGALTIVSGTGQNTIVSTVGNDVVSRISAPNLVTQGRALEVGTSSATFASTLGLLRVLSDNVSSTGTLLVLDHDGTGKLLDARQNVTSKFIVNNSGSITQATGLYHNFSLTLGDGGYGFRDLAGVMQFKDSGGAWVAFGTGGAFDPSNPGPIGDGTPSTGAFTSMDVAGGISRFSRADATPAGTASTNMDDGVFGSTDTANTGITIFSSGVGNLAFGDVADVDVGRFRFAHATNNFDWVSAGTVRMDLDGSGNLRQNASAYHNWGATVGDGGYGVRDLAGVMQVKSSGGAWVALGAGAYDNAVTTGVGLDGTSNSITTGTGIDLTTTSLTFTGGSLLNVHMAAANSLVKSLVKITNDPGAAQTILLDLSQSGSGSLGSIIRATSTSLSEVSVRFDLASQTASGLHMSSSSPFSSGLGFAHFELTNTGNQSTAPVVRIDQAGVFGTGLQIRSTIGGGSNLQIISDNSSSVRPAVWITVNSLSGGTGFYITGTPSTNGKLAHFQITSQYQGAGAVLIELTNVLSAGNALLIKNPAVGNSIEVNDGSSNVLTIVSDGNLRQNASLYHNWGATVGDSGYGFRDLAGAMQFKDSGGAWAGFGGASFDPSSPGPIGDVTPSTGAFTTGAFTSLTLAASVTTGVGFDATFNSLGVGGDGVYLHTTSPAWEDGALLHVDLAFVNTREKSLIKIEDVFGAQKTIFLELEQKGGGSIGGLIHARSDAHQQTAFLFDLASQTAPGLDMFSDNTFSSGLGFAHFSLTNTGNQSTAPVVRIDQAGVFGTGLQIRNTIGGGSGLQVIHDGGNSNNPAVNIIVNSLDGGIGFKVGGTPSSTGKLAHFESTGTFGSQGVDKAAVIMEHTNVASAGVVLLVKTVGTGPALNVIGGITVEGNTVHSSGQTRHEQNSFTTNIDCDLGHVFSQTLTTNRTFTFSNIPASGTDSFVTLILTNAGDFTITWPLSVDWAGGSPPIFTSGEVDIVTLVQYDGGSTWYASAILDVK